MIIRNVILILFLCTIIILIGEFNPLPIYKFIVDKGQTYDRLTINFNWFAICAIYVAWFAYCAKLVDKAIVRDSYLKSLDEN